MVIRISSSVVILVFAATGPTRRFMSLCHAEEGQMDEHWIMTLSHCPAVYRHKVCLLTCVRACVPVPLTFIVYLNNDVTL